MTDFSRAKCISHADIFFSSSRDRIDGDPKHKDESDKAKEICSTCPIRRDCLIWALERGEPYGIWGGYGYDERCIIAPLKGFEPPARREVEHGTERGWGWHRRRGEPACEACRLGYNRSVAERMRNSRKRKIQ